MYDPVTDASAYMLNTLNGGSVCSWIGFSYLCDLITSAVECTWAFDRIMLGSTILGAGLLMTGLTAAITILAGVGAIALGFAWVACIGESLCESTELMTAYVNGDENAGKQLESKAATHVLVDTALVTFGVTASPLFAKTHLDQKIGSFFAKAFERTSIGCNGALEILNRISPKYTNLLENAIVEYYTDGAETIARIYQNSDIEGIEEYLLDPNSIPDLGKKALKHPINKHMPSKYINQLPYTSEQSARIYLSKKSFFKMEWSEEQVKAALNFGYKEAISKGLTTGDIEYSISYLGEDVIVCLNDGVFKTGYGTYRFTYEEFKALVK